MVIGVDKTSEKISLGLKQKSASPWENVENKYPDRLAGQGQGRQRDELRRVRPA